MPQTLLEITKTKLVIGEGWEEVRFFNSLLSHLGIDNIQTEQYGGKTRLAAYLKNLPNIPGFARLESVGVTRDADDDAAAALQSIEYSLQQGGLLISGAIGAAPNNLPRVTVFIMPGGQKPGMLEDLCLKSVESDLAMSCVDEYLACVLDRSARQATNPSKARVHAWLASNEKADLRLGEAAEAGLWPWASTAFDELKAFLRDL